MIDNLAHILETTMTIRQNPEKLNELKPRDICMIYAANVLGALIIRIFNDAPGKMLLRDISGKNLRNITKNSSYLNWLGSVIAFPNQQDFFEKDLKKKMKIASDRIFIANFKDIHFPIAETSKDFEVLDVLDNLEIVLRRFSVYDSKLRDAIKGLRNLPELSKTQVASAIQDVIYLLRRVDKDSDYIPRVKHVHMQVLVAQDTDALFEEDGGGGDGGATSAGDVGGMGDAGDSGSETSSSDIASFAFPMFYRNKIIKRKKKNFKKTPLLRRIKVKNNNK